VNTGELTSGSGGVRTKVRTPRNAWCRSPFCNEVGKDLTLHGVVGLEVKLKSNKFCSSLGDVARGVGVLEDGVRDRSFGYHKEATREENEV
jgi:hypothetical protein